MPLREVVGEPPTREPQEQPQAVQEGLILAVSRELEFFEKGLSHARG